MFKKILSCFISLILILNPVSYVKAFDPGNTISLQVFKPVLMRNLYSLPDGTFNFLLDLGDNPKIQQTALTNITGQLFTYFQIGLRLPDSTFWVNLRPDSQDKIIDPLLENTDLGKALLEADVQLKKDVASYTSPVNPIGKQYWEMIYKKAEAILGSGQISIPIVNRPWIVPDEIILGQNGSGCHIYKASLKVMLESDYLKSSANYNFTDPRLKELNDYSSELMRKLILPKLTKDINSLKKYSNLRQVYYSLIMSRWFKKNARSISGMNQGIIENGDINKFRSQNSWSKQSYFQAYQKSFNNGEYSIKESYGDKFRSYISGGFVFEGGKEIDIPSKGMLTPPNSIVGHLSENDIVIGLSVPKQSTSAKRDGGIAVEYPKRAFDKFQAELQSTRILANLAYPNAPQTKEYQIIKATKDKTIFDVSGVKVELVSKGSVFSVSSIRNIGVNDRLALSAEVTVLTALNKEVTGDKTAEKAIRNEIAIRNQKIDSYNKEDIGRIDTLLVGGDVGVKENYILFKKIVSLGYKLDNGQALEERTKLEIIKAADKLDITVELVLMGVIGRDLNSIRGGNAFKDKVAQRFSSFAGISSATGGGTVSTNLVYYFSSMNPQERARILRYLSLNDLDKKGNNILANLLAVVDDGGRTGVLLRKMLETPGWGVHLVPWGDYMSAISWATGKTIVEKLIFSDSNMYQKININSLKAEDRIFLESLLDIELGKFGKPVVSKIVEALLKNTDKLNKDSATKYLTDLLAEQLGEASKSKIDGAVKNLISNHLKFKGDHEKTMVDVMTNKRTEKAMDKLGKPNKGAYLEMDSDFLFYAGNVLNLSRYFDNSMQTGSLKSLNLSLNGLSSVNSTLQALYELSGKYKVSEKGRAIRDEDIDFTLPFAGLGIESTYHWPIGFEQETIATVHEAAAIKIKGEGRDNWDIVIFGEDEDGKVKSSQAATQVISEVKILETTPLENPTSKDISTNPEYKFASTGKNIRLESASGLTTATIGEDIQKVDLKKYAKAVVNVGTANEIAVIFSEPTVNGKPSLTEEGRTAITVNGTTVFISPFAEWEYPIIINGQFICINSSSIKEIQVALKLNDSEARALEEERNKTYLSKENVGFSSLEDFWAKVRKSLKTADADSRVKSLQTLVEPKLDGVSFKGRLVIRQTRITDTDDPHPSPVSYMTSKHRIISCNVNTATVDELMVLLNVDEVTAQKIIAGRAYANREELRVKLNDDALWEKIKDAATVEGLNKRDIYLGFELDKLPPMDKKAVKLAKEGYFYFIGGGSFFTSTMCNLLYKEYVDILKDRKKEGLVRIFIVKNNADLEAAGLTIRRQMAAFLRTLNKRFDSNLKLSDLIDYIIIPDVPEIHQKNALEVKGENLGKLLDKIKSGDPSAKMSKIPLDVQKFTPEDVEYLKSQGVKVLLFRGMRDPYGGLKTGRIGVRERMLIQNMVNIAEKDALMRIAGKTRNTALEETLPEEEAYYSIAEKDKIWKGVQGESLYARFTAADGKQYTYRLNIPEKILKSPENDMERGDRWLVGMYAAEYIFNRMVALGAAKVEVNTKADFFRDIDSLMKTYINEEVSLALTQEVLTENPAQAEKIELAVTKDGVLKLTAVDKQGDKLADNDITGMILDTGFSAKSDTKTGVYGTLEQYLAAAGIVRLARLCLSDYMIDAEELETTLSERINKIMSTGKIATIGMTRQELVEYLDAKKDITPEVAAYLDKVEDVLAKEFAAVFVKYYKHFGVNTYFIKNNSEIMLGKVLGQKVAEKASNLATITVIKDVKKDNLEGLLGKIMDQKSAEKTSIVMEHIIEIYVPDAFTADIAIQRINSAEKKYKDDFYRNYEKRIVDTNSELQEIFSAPVSIGGLLPSENSGKEGASRDGGIVVNDLTVSEWLKAPTAFVPSASENKYYKNLKDARKVEIIFSSKFGTDRYEVNLPKQLTEKDIYFVSRYIYNRLGVIGAEKVFIGDAEVLKAVKENYAKEDKLFPGKYRAFYKMAKALQKVFGETLEFTDQRPALVVSNADKITFDKNEGEGVGIDIGGSDIKAVAMRGNKVLSSLKLDWDPEKFTSADQHLKVIEDLISKVTKEAGLQKIAFIGVSVNLVTINQEVVGTGPMNKGFDKLPDNEKKEQRAVIRNLKQTLEKQYNIPVGVLNDGDAAAFWAYEGLGLKNVLMLIGGTGAGAGYADKNGNIRNMHGEMGTVAIDISDVAEPHSANGMPGAAQQYFSQRPIFRLAKQKGIDTRDIPESLLEQLEVTYEIDKNKNFILDERNRKIPVAAAQLRYAQYLLENGTPEQQRIMGEVLAEVGRYLAAFIAETSDYIDVEACMIMGRLTKGAGGQIVKLAAEKVLAAESPELGKVQIAPAPDGEKGQGTDFYREYGQSIGAAYFGNRERQKNDGSVWTPKIKLTDGGLDDDGELSDIEANSETAKDRLGGIDLRSLAPTTIVSAKFIEEIEGIQVSVFDLDKEWRSIESLSRINVTLSYDRLRDFFAACWKEKELTQRAENMLAMISCMLAKQEAEAESTSAEIKSMIVLLEASR